jgi:acyl-CoA thioester hydrolase
MPLRVRYVECGMQRAGRTSLRSHFVITRGDELIAEAAMVHVCVDATTFAKEPWPQWFREKLAA